MRERVAPWCRGLSECGGERWRATAFAGEIVYLTALRVGSVKTGQETLYGTLQLSQVAGDARRGH